MSSTTSLPERDFGGYRVKYGTNSSIDMDMSTAGSETSSHALVGQQLEQPVHDWPMPESASDTSESSNVDDDDQDRGGLVSCLCYGFVVLSDLLCHIYSENDKSKEVHLSRYEHHHNDILSLILNF
jgi:hypothetical protein